MPQRIEAQWIYLTVVLVEVGGTVGQIKIKHPLQISAINARTITQIGHQTALSRTFGTFQNDVFCVRETRIQDPSSVVALRSLDGTSISYHSWCIRWYIFDGLWSGWLWDHSEHMIARVMLTWTLIGSSVWKCVAHHRQSIELWLLRFFAPVYASTDCSSLEAKDEVYQELS